MEETISLQDIFKVLKKRLWLIITLAILAVGISAAISFYVLTPIYQASTQILVNQKQTEQQNQIQTQDIQANLQLINTYSVIIKSPVVLDKVIEMLDLDMSANTLSGKITVSNANNSQVVNISVQDEKPYMAVDIANTVAEVFQEEVQDLMNVDNVNILSKAELPKNPAPVKPNKMLNIAIALVIGIMLGVGLAFLLEYLDTTVKTEKDVEELLELPILGFVSKITEPKKSKRKEKRRKKKMREEKVHAV